MKIQLHTEPDDALTRWRRTGFPFAVNPRGWLVHRVRSIREHLTACGKVRHVTIEYLCKAFSHSAEETEHVPSKGLVCTACEQAAAKKRLRSSEQLNGGAVNFGTVKARKCHLVVVK